MFKVLKKAKSNKHKYRIVKVEFIVTSNVLNDIPDGCEVSYFEAMVQVKKFIFWYTINRFGNYKDTPKSFSGRYLQAINYMNNRIAIDNNTNG